MPLDVELSELNAGGIKEPNAKWTAQAKPLVVEAVRNFLKEKHASLNVVEAAEPEQDLDSTEVQLLKLHGAVGTSILIHQYIEELKLPTKAGAFNWTLGPDAAVLRKRYDADYALFVYVRDSYTSAGRAAVIFVAAVFGVGVQGGTQVGFASLVDLKTGQIVWFNRLFRTTGDLREPEPAKVSVEHLLTNFPGAK